MSEINEKANGVAVRLLPKLPTKYTLDPMLLLTLASLVAKLVMALYKCYNDDVKAAWYAGHLGIIGRWRLRTIVRRHLRKSELEGYTVQVADAIESEAAGVFPSQFAALRAETQQINFGEEE